MREELRSIDGWNQTIGSNQPVLFDLGLLADRKERDWTDSDSRGYTVNDKQNEIANSPVAAISLFSGACGLDIGTQLAGAKVISSLDFDLDSVSTLIVTDDFRSIFMDS